jgi:hypothetical protein
MSETITEGRSGKPAAARVFRLGLVLLVLLAAAAFRLADLPSAPPGMTHDEADHGLTAWQIVNGARDLYFTVGYGREPLYDYATALVMIGTGPAILAARLTSVYFSLLMIAAVYAWGRSAFGTPVALLAAAGLAVGFWPVMAGRQALRSIALPALFSLAVLPFWGALTDHRWRPTASRIAVGRVRKTFVTRNSSLVAFLMAGLLLGLTFYTYIPARVMWLALPALSLYLFISPRSRCQNRTNKPGLLAGTTITLLVAAVVASPLFVYLAANPGLEVRIDELSAPLRAAAAGDFDPLLGNASGALRLFTIEGDQTWRYNIPGRPFLGPVLGVLFYAGLVVAGWLALSGLRKPASADRPRFLRPENPPGAFLALVWLFLGFAPVLVTGPGLSVTQAIGALPVLYLFPALAMVAGHHALTIITNLESSERVTRRSSLVARNTTLTLLAVVLFASISAFTARDYFGRWVNAPEVRVQYETAMVTALDYLNEHVNGATAISTITPGRFHAPAVALMTLRNPAVRPRWFDGRHSLILPGEPEATIVIPGFTPVPPLLQSYLDSAELSAELPMRPDDLDRPVLIYALDGEAAQENVLRSTVAETPGATLPLRFGDRLQLLGYALPSARIRSGEALSLVTAWRIVSPLPDASLFAQVLGDDGRPIATSDVLGAPGEAWVPGDILLQLHQIELPAGMPAGAYPLVTGAYSRSDGRRLVPEGSAVDYLELAEVMVAGE